mmetsp:Transcript_101473/g.183120  ORF Transcript_101473/g.183120 Transcript_101473/m.183120 type:complete len:244 (+) Transcript_101473:947-1678(+)
MATSLAPSPMARVIVLPPPRCFTISTRDRFCLGESRQQTQAEADVASSTSICHSPAASSLASASLSADLDMCGIRDLGTAVAASPSAILETRSRNAPSMTRASPSLALEQRCACAACSMAMQSSSDLASTNLMSFWSFRRRLHDFAISIAVSVLSPVSIQICIPIAFNVAMASGTPSCSLSSRAVMPASFRECSIFAEHSVMSRSLSAEDAFLALSYSSCHSSNSARSRALWAITSVRSPRLL